MIALALLAAAAGAGLSGPWWLLAIPFVGGVLKARAFGSLPHVKRQVGSAREPAEEVVATIYVRAGRLVLRRRKVGKA